MKDQYTRCITINGITRYENETRQYFVGGSDGVQDLYDTFVDQAEWWGVSPVSRNIVKSNIGGIEVDYKKCEFRVMTVEEINEALSLE